MTDTQRIPLKYGFGMVPGRIDLSEGTAKGDGGDAVIESHDEPEEGQPPLVVKGSGFKALPPLALLALSSSAVSDAMKRVERTSSMILVLAASVAFCVAMFAMGIAERPIAVAVMAGGAVIATSYLATQYVIKQHERIRARARHC